MCKQIQKVLVFIALALLAMASFAYAERDYGEVPFLLAYPSTKQFPAEQRYPVYTGPGEHYLRGDGDAIVSTNGPIRVYGEENGWLLVEYTITKQSDRVGYIPASHLLPGQQVEPLVFSYSPAVITKQCTLTDDPNLTQRVICILDVGHDAIFLGYFSSGWAYVETTTDKGELIRGCVPLRSITIYPKENDMDSLLEGLPVDNEAIADYEPQYMDYSYTPLPSSIAWSVSPNGNIVSAYITASSKSRRIDVFDETGDISWSVRKGYLDTDAARATVQIIQDSGGFSVLFFDDAAMTKRLQTKYTWDGKERGKDSTSATKSKERYVVESLPSFNVYVSADNSADAIEMIVEHRKSGKQILIKVTSKLPYAYVEHSGCLYLVAANEKGQLEIGVFDDKVEQYTTIDYAGATQVAITAENQHVYVVASDTQESSVLVYDAENRNLIGSTSFEMPQGWSIDAIYKGTDRYLILITDDITTNSDGDKIGTSRLCSVTKDGTLFLVKDLDQRAVRSYQLADGKVHVISQSVLHGWPDAAFYLNRIIVK